MIPIIIEKLAEYAHNAWAGWMKYMFSKGKLNDAGEMVLPKWAVDRWTRQMNTSYADLPEDEKKSDRDEANQMLKIIYDDITSKALQWTVELVELMGNTPHHTVSSPQ